MEEYLESKSSLCGCKNYSWSRIVNSSACVTIRLTQSSDWTARSTKATGWWRGITFGILPCPEGEHLQWARASDVIAAADVWSSFEGSVSEAFQIERVSIQIPNDPTTFSLCQKILELIQDRVTMIIVQQRSFRLWSNRRQLLNFNLLNW